MTPTTDPILQQYIVLTEFLGKALGPDYEVVLHDLTEPSCSIIAIANEHVSGRKIGAPLTNMALAILRDRSYEDSDFRVRDQGMSINGKSLRSNTMFIKKDGELIGMLCINFDDSRYRQAAEILRELAHPGSLPEDRSRFSFPDVSAQNVQELYSNSAEGVAADAVSREMEKLGLTGKRLRVADRLKIVGALEASGIFLLKGVVKDVAEALHCSQASVYRYLSQVKNENTDTAGIQ